jgi:hypothetical protein
MAIKLYECDCLFEEVGEGIGNVKGYVKVSECSVCVAKREADTLAAETKRLADEEAASTKETNKQAAISKLLVLGLTQDEIDSLIG